MPRRSRWAIHALLVFEALAFVPSEPGDHQPREAPAAHVSQRLVVDHVVGGASPQKRQKFSRARGDRREAQHGGRGDGTRGRGEGTRRGFVSVEGPRTTSAGAGEVRRDGPLSVTGWSEDEHTLLCNGPLPLVKVQSGPASTATWAASLPDVRTVCAVPVPAAAALQYIDALIVIGPRKGRPPNHDLVVAVSVTRLRCRGSLRGLAGLAGRFGNDHFVPVRGRTRPATA